MNMQAACYFVLCFDKMFNLKLEISGQLVCIG